MKISCFKGKKELAHNDVVTYTQPYRAVKRQFGKDKQDMEVKLFYNNNDKFTKFEFQKGSVDQKTYNKLKKEITNLINSTLEYYKDIEKKKA